MGTRKTQNGTEGSDGTAGSALAGQPKPVKPLRVIGGGENAVPMEYRPPPKKLPVLGGEEDRLTTEELRQRFARNLDRLLSLIGLSRKDAADEMSVPYPLVRRLVSAGVSRTDERGTDDLNKIATYFTLNGVEDLWRADLVQTVLDPTEGRAFIQKFRARLLAERERRLADASVPTVDELGLLSRALGFGEPPATPLTGPDADKVAVILASPKADTFRRLIDDYYELIKRRNSDPDERRAARG